MTTQRTLFGEPAGPDPFNGTKHPRRPCTPARVGTGPAGERCGTCRHLARSESPAGNVFLKCGLMRRHWTGGGATDVKAAWSACRLWEER